MQKCVVCRSHKIAPQDERIFLIYLPLLSSLEAPAFHRIRTGSRLSFHENRSVPRSSPTQALHARDAVTWTTVVCGTCFVCRLECIAGQRVDCLSRPMRKSRRLLRHVQLRASSIRGRLLLISGRRTELLHGYLACQLTDSLREVQKEHKRPLLEQATRTILRSLFSSAVLCAVHAIARATIAEEGPFLRSGGQLCLSSVVLRSPVCSLWFRLVCDVEQSPSTEKKACLHLLDGFQLS